MFFTKKNFRVIIAFFANFKCKCEKNFALSNIMQNVKSYFLPISIILRLIETVKPPYYTLTIMMVVSRTPSLELR